jgi:hypothetical protein
MGEHLKLMEQTRMSRSDYLSALRKEQPILELERKAHKALRRGAYTQEDLDLAIARGVNLAVELSIM